MPKINSLEVVHQDTNADKYDNLHDLLVKFKKFYDESAGKEVVDAEARAAYEVLMEMYVNDKEAFAKRVETLSAKFGNSLAQVVEEMLAYASQSEAWAKKITTVEAELGNAKASIETESYVRATEDEALASQITTVEASVASNAAAITAETTARVTADSALASDITTVEARLDTGDFAAVKTESSATASKVSGIEAKWGVTTNVNGYVAGIQLLNGGSTSSSFTVAADKFIVKKPDGSNGIAWNGSTSRLDISGDVYANAFYGNVVATGNINTNAVTSNGSLVTTVYSWSEASTTFTSTGSPVVILLNIVYNGAYPDGSPINFSIDGTLYKQWYAPGDYMGSEYEAVLTRTLSLSAGTHTFRFWGFEETNYCNIYFSAIELKR